MKKLQALLIILLILLSIDTVATIPVKAQTNTLSQFVFNTLSTPQTAGSAFTITITAKASNGNTITSYTGTNTLTVSSGTITPTATTAFVAGVWTGQVRLSQAGTGISISTSGSGKSGTTNKITVNPGVLDHFIFNTISSPQTVGKAFSITITAKDANSNTVTSYTGTNTLATSSGTISPTSTGKFSSGSWTGSVTLSAAGSAITISTSGSSKSATSNSFTVNSLSLSYYVFNTISTPQTAGSPFAITITAKASNGNTITSYTGKPTLSISVGTINPTVTGAFSNGVWTGTVMTTGAGSDVTIMATDGSNSGLSNSFNVNSGVANHLVVSSGTSQVAGIAFSVTVTAKDTYGNTATSFTGRIHFSSSNAGPGVSLPSDYKFQSGDLGIHTFTNSVTLMMVGTGFSVTATDTATASIAGSQTGITVNRAGVVNVVISPSGSSVTAGASKTYSATASDAFGNSWDVTSLTNWSINSDSGGTWSGNVFTSAVAGSWNVTGTYASKSYSTGLIVNPASLDHFTFNTVAPQMTGTPFSITVTAQDAYNNTATSYAGQPSLIYSAGLISPINIDAFVSGVGSALVTVNVAGSNVTIKATDNTHSGISNSFLVNPTISASAGVGGVINPTGNVSVNYWGSQNFNITPNTGYSIADVTADNISLGPVSTYTFTGVQSTHTITAIFGISTLNISVFVGAGGSINPSGSVSVNYGASQTFNIKPSADYYIVDVLVNASSVGAVNSYTFTNVQTSNTISAIFAPTPTSTPSSIATQNPAPTQTVKPSNIPTQTPSPTPLPKPIFNSPTLQATFPNGSIVDLEINGITALTVMNATISRDPLVAQTTLSLTIIGQNITNNVNAITVPKTTVNYGAIPKIYVNSQVAPDQGFSQDANNYYVWYKTIFRDYELSIVFAANAAPDGFPLWIILFIFIIVFSLSVTALVLSKKRKGNYEEYMDYSAYG